MKQMTHEEVLDEINVLYERLQSLEDCEGKYVGCGYCSFNDGRYLEALEILIDYYEVGLIEELEKIKEKINSEDVNCRYEEDYIYSSGLQKAIDIIDNYIEELKGENNELN